MNENVDLIKILDGCPKGTKFYSTIHDEISFKRIELSSDYPMVFDSDVVGREVTLTEKGTELRGVGECIVFPSKDQRDWSKFERFWDKPKIERFDPNTLQPFDKVLVRNETDKPWQCDWFSHYVRGNTYPYICIIGDIWKQYILPYNGETMHLVGTTDDCPEYYKWWKNLED